jgi:hypothetical protein
VNKKKGCRFPAEKKPGPSTASPVSVKNHLPDLLLDMLFRDEPEPTQDFPLPPWRPSCHHGGSHGGCQDNISLKQPNKAT